MSGRPCWPSCVAGSPTAPTSSPSAQTPTGRGLTTDAVELRVGGRVVRLSSSDRVLFPRDGVTKGDLFAYYREVAPAIVPHLRGRPFTMKLWRAASSCTAF